MLPTGEFKTVPTDSIIITNEWNLTPFLAPSPSTNKSHPTTPATGILHPPIVKKSNTNKTKYELLCGKDRFKSFRNHCPDKTHITVLVLPPDISYDEILQFVLHDKLVSGAFSFMEKAIFLQYCCRHLSPEDVAKTFLPLLDEKPQSYVIKKLLSLTTLEPALQQSIHTGQLSHKLGHELLPLSSVDRTTLHELFQQLELGGGKQKRLFTLCKELAFRQDKDITLLLTGDDYLAILTHSEMNVPQKGASLLNLLHKQLFPESNKAEDNFRKRVSHMGLPANCIVEHSLAFERDEISVKVHFKNMEQLEKRAHIIKELFS